MWVTHVKPSRLGGSKGEAVRQVLKKRPPERESMENVNASDYLSQVEDPTRSVAFTKEEMGALHRFFGQVMLTPEDGFEDTAPALASQLHELVEEHLGELGRSRYEREDFDSTLP